MTSDGASDGVVDSTNYVAIESVADVTTSVPNPALITRCKRISVEVQEMRRRMTKGSLAWRTARVVADRGIREPCPFWWMLKEERGTHVLPAIPMDRVDQRGWLPTVGRVLTL